MTLAAADLKPFRLNPEDVAPHIGPEFQAASRRALLLTAALHLTALGRTWALLGRGPNTFDEFGFVRACAQCAIDWDPEHGERLRGPPLADLEPRVSETRPGGYLAGDMGAQIEAWGMVRRQTSPGWVTRQAAPGDIIIFIGRSFDCGVLLRAFDPAADVDALFAVASPHHDPVIGAQRFHFAVAAYHWPEDR